MPQEETPRGRGASNNLNTPSIAETTLSNGCSWLFSPVRVAAFEAEQRALAGFARVAEAMPDVARRKTAELVPSEDDGVIRMVRRLP